MISARKREQFALPMILVELSNEIHLATHDIMIDLPISVFLLLVRRMPWYTYVHTWGWGVGAAIHTLLVELSSIGRFHVSLSFCVHYMIIDDDLLLAAAVVLYQVHDHRPSVRRLLRKEQNSNCQETTWDLRVNKMLGRGLY